MILLVDLGTAFEQEIPEAVHALTGAVFATAVAAGGAGTSTFTVMWWMTAAVGLVALLVSPRVRRV